ncbi:hypothetical protein EPO66_03615 [bacterium]|nr:MAG: hypothetical protein EPO66_03615 [bacterium]
MIGEGGLRLSKTCAWDGVVYFNVLSPTLLFKMWFSKKRDNNTNGIWLFVGNTIIWFRKLKRKEDMYDWFCPVCEEVQAFRIHPVTHEKICLRCEEKNTQKARHDFQEDMKTIPEV